MSTHASLLQDLPTAPARRDYFQELGVKPIINAGGAYTALTSALMEPEVVRAIEYASRRFVRLSELHDACGRRVASLIGCEAAMISAGAASALTLGTAACMTGTNPEFIRSLPDTAGMKTDVIIQKGHRYGYDHAVRNCGIRFVEVESAAGLEHAVNSRTAMMLFCNHNEPAGSIKAAEFAALGGKHGVPTFIDAAADTPPVEALSRFTKMGFDLVAFSGGKGIRGPQSCGLLLGRKDLIAAARLHGPPNIDTIGRGMKVNKEEMLGMTVAIEQFIERDHAAEWKEWEERIEAIAETVMPLGVKAETFIPVIANAVPHLRISWTGGIAYDEVVKRLREGDPSIELRPDAKDCLEVAVWMLQPGETEIVARRLREVLQPG